MKAKNLDFFEKVFDMVLELNCEDEEESLCIAGSIIAHYDWKRVKYAVEHEWHLYDLDRWEMVGKSFGRIPRYWTNVLHKLGFSFTYEECVEIMRDGQTFIEKIVDPLWEADIEIMDLVPEGAIKRTKRSCTCRDALTK